MVTFSGTPPMLAGCNFFPMASEPQHNLAPTFIFYLPPPCQEQVAETRAYSCVFGMNACFLSSMWCRTHSAIETRYKCHLLQEAFPNSPG